MAKGKYHLNSLQVYATGYLLLYLKSIGYSSEEVSGAIEDFYANVMPAKDELDAMEAYKAYFGADKTYFDCFSRWNKLDVDLQF